MPNSEEIQCKVDWVPLTVSKKMQKKLLVVTEFVVSGKQCNLRFLGDDR